MSNIQASDALIFFGATGDLAHKKVGQQVELAISEEPDPSEMGAYEELLYDAVQGDSGRFARQHYVEEA